MAEDWSSDFPGAFDAAPGASADDGGAPAASASAVDGSSGAADGAAASVVSHVVRVSNLPLGVRSATLRDFFASCGVLDGGVVVLHNSASEALLALESTEDRERALRKNFEKMGKKCVGQRRRQSASAVRGQERAQYRSCGPTPPPAPSCARRCDSPPYETGVGVRAPAHGPRE